MNKSTDELINKSTDERIN